MLLVEKEAMMSLKPQPIPPGPEETARVARAAFPRGNVDVKLLDWMVPHWHDSHRCDRFQSDRLLERSVRTSDIFLVVFGEAWQAFPVASDDFSIADSSTASFRHMD